MSSGNPSPTAGTLTRPGYHAGCLYEAARRESERYRRQLEERLGQSMGTQAVAEWNRLHWWRWVCGRVLEHVRGEVFWQELEGNRFAAYSDRPDLLRPVTDEIVRIQERLAMNGLVPHEERRSLEIRLAELVNQLLA